MSAGDDELFGYVLVHFVEDPDGHSEKIFLSRSIGDDPRRWERLNQGRPILESTSGTTGIRDPYLIRTDHGFALLATDLRIWGDYEHNWEQWTRHGSRSLLVWETPDLLTWSESRLVEVAPSNAGMAWAPEAVRDPDTGEFLVFWSSKLYDHDDREHAGDSYSRILVSRTRDFRTFSPAEVLVDSGRDVIDMTAVLAGGRVHRVLKEAPEIPGSKRVYHEVGFDFFGAGFDTLATRIGDDLFTRLEAPLIFRDNHRERWYLFLDQYERRPQGYIGFWTDDLAGGDWNAFSREEFHMPPNTKHGAVVPLRRHEWQRLETLNVELGREWELGIRS